MVSVLMNCCFLGFPLKGNYYCLKLRIERPSTSASPCPVRGDKAVRAFCNHMVTPSYIPPPGAKISS